MGLITNVFGFLFGNNRNVVVETAQVFRENAEASAIREAAGKQAALSQFSAEFRHPRKGAFDRMVDGLNRLPRPMLAFGTLGLFVSAMVDPIWFAARMQGIALVPEPMWWLMGAIVSFYFGARHQVKGQEFQQSIADTMSRAGQVTQNIRALDALNSGSQISVESDADGAGPNPALEAWRSDKDGQNG